MKNQELRSSLIKSGILLGLCVFLIYAFAAGDSGGVGGTIGSLFSALLFIVGLTIALAVSILILIGIYFGILYMYDQRDCKKTYDEFKGKVSTISGSYSSKCCSSTQEATPAAIIDADLEPLRSSHNRQSGQLSSLQSSVDSVTASVSTLTGSVSALQEALADLESKASTMTEEMETKASTSDIDDSAKKLAADISSVQSSVTPLSDKLGQLEETLGGLAPGDEDEGDAVQEKIDQAVSSLQDDIAAVKASIGEMAKSTQAAAEEGSDDDGAQRILSYFTGKKDKEKFVALVEEAVAKGMTYAQVGEYLTDSLSAKAKDVIAEHPSLTKDFIKDIRQQNK